MDTTLITVTLLSMGMAAALSVIVWRMLRDERRRGEARVLALAAAASRPGDAVPARPASVFETAVDDHRPSTVELPLHPSIASNAGMFAEPDTASPWAQRLAVMAGVGMVVASVILLSLAAGNGGRARFTAPPPSGAAAGSPRETPSLPDSSCCRSVTTRSLAR